MKEKLWLLCPFYRCGESVLRQNSGSASDSGDNKRPLTQMCSRIVPDAASPSVRLPSSWRPCGGSTSLLFQLPGAAPSFSMWPLPRLPSRSTFRSNLRFQGFLTLPLLRPLNKDYRVATRITRIISSPMTQNSPVSIATFVL